MPEAGCALGKILNKKIYRVIDANLNRAKEGLRVCEDTVRFILKDKILTKKIKKLRHDITRIAADPDTKLIKEERLLFLICEACGARHSVSK